MQLTANGAHMVVDFYPVKYSDGTISERLMYKTVTFCDRVQSKSYINKVSFEKEVENRVEGYKYEVTDMHTEPQLFNSALIQTRWWFMSLIKSYLHTLEMNNQLEMLSQREQLMWDIDGIVEEFACNNNINEDDMEDLIRTLCDTVCKNFPTN